MCGSKQKNSDEQPRAVSPTSTSQKISSKEFLHKQPCTLSDKEQFPKPMRQSVRDDLHREIMILPSSHMLEAMGAAA